MYDWQTLVALAVVFLAAAGLVMRVRKWSRTAEAGGCGTCPHGTRTDRSKQLPLAQLQLKVDGTPSGKQ